MRRSDGATFEPAVTLPFAPRHVRLHPHAGGLYAGYRVGAEARIARLAVP